MVTTNRDPIKTYLTQIGRYPLLTGDQEIQLARQIQAGLAAGNLPPSEERERQAERNRVINAGVKAKEKMIRHNLRLVVSIAKKYQNRGLEMLDLIQEGNLGLNRAAEKFDPEKGFKFSTYAHWWIRQGITRAIADQNRVIRCPVHVREKLNKLKQFTSDFAQKNGRNPNRTELKEHFRLDDQRLDLLISANRAIASLDAIPVYAKSENISYGDLIADPDSDLFKSLNQATNQAVADRYLIPLTQQEKTVIAMRYGFSGGKPSTLNQIAKALNLSRERIRQIQNRALKKMRQLHKVSPKAAATDLFEA